MKSINELQIMLLEEIELFRNELNNELSDLYFNSILGDSSFLIAGILEQYLQMNFKEWEEAKWLDDSLITKAKLNANKLTIWGIMIWGRIGTTQQWTDPFYFEIMLNDNGTDFIELTFLYEDEETPEITYKEFTQNRNMWDRNFYSNGNWNPSERNWKYIIHSKNDMSV